MLENSSISLYTREHPSYVDIQMLIVAPFADGAARSVGRGALYILVVWYRELGAVGFVTYGSTGEATALTDQERAGVLDTVRVAIDGLPAVMGVSGSAFASVRERVLHLVGHRPATLLIPAHSYIRPSQDRVIKCFTVLADASPMPVLLYNISYHIDANIGIEALLALVVHPNIHGIKNCDNDADKTQRLIVDGRLQVLTGENTQVFGTLYAGGVGMVIAVTHVRTELFVEVTGAVQEQRLNNVRRLHYVLIPAIRLLFAEANPGPLKT